MAAKKTNAPRETRYTACAPNHSSSGSKPAAPPAACTTQGNFASMGLA